MMFSFNYVKFTMSKDIIKKAVLPGYEKGKVTGLNQKEQWPLK
jgi:hypothetical protein